MREGISDLKNFIDEAIAAKVFPGCTYAILYDNDVYIDYAGMKSVYPLEEKNSLKTKYDLAALTMVIVTNVLVSILLERGTLKIDDNIGKFIPSYNNPNITIFELLTHTSGLPADIDTTNLETEEELIDAIKNLDLVAKQSEKIIYSEINFLLLGLILEKVTGKKIEALAKKEIFDKLNMKNTMFNPVFQEECAPTEIDNGNVIRGSVHDKKAMLLKGMAGHDGLFSDINDLVNFTQMILDNGIYVNKKVMDKELVNLWFEEMVSTRLGYDNKTPHISVNGNARSFGWILGENYYTTGDYASDNTISHTGFTGCSILIDKDNKLGLILLSNRVHPTKDNKEIHNFRPKLINKVYEVFINKEVNNE